MRTIQAFRITSINEKKSQGEKSSAFKKRFKSRISRRMGDKRRQDIIAFGSEIRLHVSSNERIIKITGRGRAIKW